MAKHDACLVLSAGSSVLRFSVFRQVEQGKELALVLFGQISGFGGAVQFKAEDAQQRTLANHRWDDKGSHCRQSLCRYLLRWIRSRLVEDRIVVVGHAIANVGNVFDQSLHLTAERIRGLEAMVSHAPQEILHSLAAIRAVEATSPYLPQVACPDSTFQKVQAPATRMMEEMSVARHALVALLAPGSTDLPAPSVLARETAMAS